ncbi:MAG: hypothetical protein ACJ74H_02265 [Thermoanaerobaculia bacterium]
MKRAVFAIAIVFAAAARAQFSTADLKPVGYHPSNIAYFNTPYFANALFHGGEWFSFTGSEFGTPVDFNNTAQFVSGYPQFLNAGQKLRAPLFGLNIDDDARAALAKGRIVVTWNGTADIRLIGGALIAAESPSGASGSFTNGRRVYFCDATAMQSIEVHAIGATAPSEIRVWLDGLEGQLFHPLLLQRIADRDWGFIRFMDWGATNASPVMNWSDRRLPVHIFQNGIINDRSPALDDTISPGDRETGVAYEHMVALCNATGKNLWINVPHLASADFMTRLAKLIRFGSDGVNPYDAPNANPVHPPLNASLKVYVEYSNEIWSSGFSFPQGNWAEHEAALAGISKARFNGRKFCDTWSAFQSVFGSTTRLIRVAATFTASDTYTTAFLNEIDDYGPTLTPAVAPDVLAVTTYFGNGIQEFVDEQGFTEISSANLTIAFDEWKRRIMAGDAVQGAGPDATGIGGGFSAGLRDFGLPIIAYEGGPSLYTDTIGDDGVTAFIEEMNRDPRIAELYRIHLEVARSKGLWTHTPYTDTSTWSRFGQWGHLETLDQTPADAPKYALMLEHFDTFSTLRHIDDPIGAVPQFSTGATLPPGIVGEAYTTDIVTSGGNGTNTVTVIGAFLEPGLSIAAGPSSGTLRITGTPMLSRKNFILARVYDADGDPAWRVFTLQTFGGLGTLVQSDFRGTSPALNRPWTPAFVLSPKVTWSGWNIGAGIVPKAGNDAFVFSVSADNQFLTATITPAQGPLDLRGGEIRFSIRRIDFHSPLSYALSAGGSQLYVSSAVSKDNFDEIEHVVTIPSTAAFSAVNAPLELRIHAFGAEFDGHRTSLTAFKLTQSASVALTAPENLAAIATSSTQIALTWDAVTGATYEIFRRSAGVAETQIGTSVAGSFNDTVDVGTAHVYRVRAAASGATSAFSNATLATAVMFTDDPLFVNATRIKRAHLVELRAAVNAVRAVAGLPAATLTDPTITANVTRVKAAHVTELRTALANALTALGFPAPVFSTSSQVKAAHFAELRNALK